MEPTIAQFLRCPVSGRELTLVEVSRQDDGDVVEGTLVEEASGNAYEIHSRLPLLLGPNRKAVDDFAVLLSAYGEQHGFAEAIRRLSGGQIEYPIHEALGLKVSAADQREADVREDPGFWDTFSRNRLIQQQLNAIDTHWDALEELWLRGEVNLADTILDVGTGWGGSLHHMLEHSPQDALVFGLDTAFLNLKIAQSRAAHAGYANAHFIVGDISEPPFAPMLFDSVVSWYGLGATPGFRRALEGMALVMAPGAAFAAAWTPVVLDMDGLAGADELHTLAARFDMPVDPEDAARGAQDAGFEDVEVVEAGPISILQGRSPADAPEF